MQFLFGCIPIVGTIDGDRIELDQPDVFQDDLGIVLDDHWLPEEDDTDA